MGMLIQETDICLSPQDKATRLYNPRQISGLVLWLDANDLNGILNNGNAVTTWYDKSGYGHNAVQSNATYKPIFYKNKWSGNSVLYSDNTTKHYMVITRTADLEPSYITIVGAYIFNSALGYGYFISKPARATNSWSSPYAEYAVDATYATLTGRLGTHLMVSTSLYKHAYATNMTASKYANNLAILSYDGTAGGINIQVNDDDLALTNVTGSAYTGAINYGVDNADISLFTNTHYYASRVSFGGYIGEIMLFNSVLSAANKTIIFNYLSTKYGQLMY